MKPGSLLLFLILASSRSILNGQDIETRSASNLKGPVQSVLEMYSYPVTIDTAVPRCDTSAYAVYDTAGRLQMKIYRFEEFSESGSSLQDSEGILHFFYDEAGKLKSKTDLFTYLISAPEPGEETLHIIEWDYQYDKKGRLIRDHWTCSYEFAPPEGTTVYKFDPRGNIKEEKGFEFKDSSGAVPEWIHQYIYDNGNRLTESRYYDYWKTNRKISTRIKYQYDDNGNETMVTTWGEEAKVREKVVKVYDSLGRILETKIYSSGENPRDIYQYTRDSSGTEVKYISSGYLEHLPQTRSIKKFDPDGHLISMTWFLENGSLDSAFTFEYEFDEYGNWIRLKKISGYHVVEIFTRKIKYYPE